MAQILISANPHEVTPGDTGTHILRFDFDTVDVGEKFVTLKVQSGTFKFNSKLGNVNDSPVYSADDEFKFSTKSSANFCLIQDQGGSGVLEVSYI